MLQAPIPIDGSQESDFQGIATTWVVHGASAHAHRYRLYGV